MTGLQIRIQKIDETPRPFRLESDAAWWEGMRAAFGDREVLQESYRTSIPHIPSRPYVNRDLVARALKTSRRDAARRAEAEQFYDNSLIKELDDSGFIGTLFGKR